MQKNKDNKHNNNNNKLSLNPHNGYYIIVIYFLCSLMSLP